MLALLKKLLAHSADCYWIFDLHKQELVYASDTLLTLYGLSKEDLRKNPNFRAKYTIEEERSIFLFEEVILNKNRTWEATYKIKQNGTGKIKQIHEQRYFLDDEKRYIASIIKELSLKKEYKKILAATQNIYRHLFEHNPLPAWVYDIKTLQFLFVNQAACQKYGYSREEFAQMTIKDIRPKEEIEKLEKRLKAIKKGHYNSDTKWIHQLKNGEKIWVKLNSYGFDYQGKSVEMVVIHDITDSVKAAAEIQHYTRQLDTIFESITDGFFALDKNWNFIRVNKEFEKILNRKRENLIGRNLWIEFADAVDSDFYIYYHKAMQTQETQHFTTLHNYEGRGIWFSVSVYPSEKGLAIYFRDVSKQKQNEIRIYEQNRQLREIAKISSHSVRRPVASILGLMQIFDKENIENPFNLEIIDHLQTVTEELDAVIHQIVSMSYEVNEEGMGYWSEEQTQKMKSSIKSIESNAAAKNNQKK
ncbi:MAG: PAS domain S-box protein [Bernardetiaceae bacterium]|nr:PAS domain S-box protein [Bernardetiaceae bacterium]